LFWNLAFGLWPFYLIAPCWNSQRGAARQRINVNDVVGGMLVLLPGGISDTDGELNCNSGLLDGSSAGYTLPRR
jgi:hypothetical protein